MKWWEGELVGRCPPTPHFLPPHIFFLPHLLPPEHIFLPQQGEPLICPQNRLPPIFLPQNLTRKRCTDSSADLTDPVSITWHFLLRMQTALLGNKNCRLVQADLAGCTIISARIKILTARQIIQSCLVRKLIRQSKL